MAPVTIELAEKVTRYYDVTTEIYGYGPYVFDFPQYVSDLTY
jgi:hypothetical protein